MLDKLEAIKVRYEDIQVQMNEPSVMSDMKNYIKLNKDYKELQPIMEAFEVYKTILSNIDNAKDIIHNEKDEEFRTMAKEELNLLTAEKDKIEEDIRMMLIPVMKQVFLPGTFTGCTVNSRKRNAGKLTWWTSLREPWVDSRRSSSTSLERMFMD
jgi:PCRF domain